MRSKFFAAEVTVGIFMTLAGTAMAEHSATQVRGSAHPVADNVASRADVLFSRDITKRSAAVTRVWDRKSLRLATSGFGAPQMPMPFPQQQFPMQQPFPIQQQSPYGQPQQFGQPYGPAAQQSQIPLAPQFGGPFPQPQMPPPPQQPQMPPLPQQQFPQAPPSNYQAGYQQQPYGQQSPYQTSQYPSPYPSYDDYGITGASSGDAGYYGSQYSNYGASGCELGCDYSTDFNLDIQGSF